MCGDIGYLREWTGKDLLGMRPSSHCCAGEGADGGRDDKGLPWTPGPQAGGDMPWPRAQAGQTQRHWGGAEERPNAQAPILRKWEGRGQFRRGLWTLVLGWAQVGSGWGFRPGDWGLIALGSNVCGIRHQ